MTEPLCQTCKHEQDAHLDKIGPCATDTSGWSGSPWCSCVQFVPIPAFDHDVALDEQGLLDERAGARPQTWAEQYAWNAARDFTSLPTFERQIARLIEGAVRDALEKAAELCEQDGVGLAFVGEAIRKLGTAP